jgi:hypothetical protein
VIDAAVVVTAAVDVAIDVSVVLVAVVVAVFAHAVASSMVVNDDVVDCMRLFKYTRECVLMWPQHTINTCADM